jgi:hypothetical protein
MNSESFKAVDHLYIWRRTRRMMEFYWVSGDDYSLIKTIPLMELGLPELARDMAQLDERRALSKQMISVREFTRALYDAVAGRPNDLWLRIDPGDKLLAGIPWEEFFRRIAPGIKRWPFFTLSPWRREEAGGNVLLILSNATGPQHDLTSSLPFLLKDLIRRRANLMIVGTNPWNECIPLDLPKMKAFQTKNFVRLLDLSKDASALSRELSTSKQIFNVLRSPLLRTLQHRITVAIDTVCIAAIATIRGDKGGLLLAGPHGSAEFLACGELVEFLASIGASKLLILVEGGSAVAARHLAHEVTSIAPVDVEVADARTGKVRQVDLSRQDELSAPLTPVVRYESPLAAALEEESPLRQASQEFLLNHTVAKSLDRSIESSDTLRWLQPAQRFLERGAARAFEDSLRFPESSDEGREAWKGVISGLQSLSEALAPPEREDSTRTVRTAI